MHRIHVVLLLVPSDPPVYLSAFHGNCLIRQLAKELLPQAAAAQMIYHAENPAMMQVLLDFKHLPIRSEVNHALGKVVKRLQARGLQVVERRDYLKLPERPDKGQTPDLPPARQRVRKALLRIGGAMLLVSGFPAIAG